MSETEVAPASGDSVPEPDEFAAEPLAATLSLSVASVEALRQPLDPTRIKKRDGRGGGKFEYLAVHDVVRTANRIFGFGNWGHEVLTQDRIGEVEVEKRPEGGGQPKVGYHVGYRCVVRLTVHGCVPVSGTGYGDGVEYGPAAQITASELALKESESDALKRALKNYGDQFGLILYAKVDERAQIESTSNEATAIRRDPTSPRPEGWVELRTRFADVLGGVASSEAETEAWIGEAVQAKYAKSSAEMDEGEKREVFIRLSAVLIALEEAPGDLAFDADARNTIARAFAQHFDGAALHGPEWRVSPADPASVQSYDDWLATDSDEPVDEKTGKPIPFGEEPSERAVAEAEHDRERAQDRTG